MDRVEPLSPDIHLSSDGTRPSFISIYMNLAFLLSQRATCSRLNVGTVITTTDFRKVLSVGYNGNATGLPNRCDTSIPGSCGCLHSEENAVINCDSPRHIPKIVFVTHLPCNACAKRLINLGFVEQVYYCHSYRCKASIETLKMVGIGIEQVPPPTVAGHSHWEDPAPRPRQQPAC